MSVASPEYASFDPRADYQLTLNTYTETFATNVSEVMDLGKGRRLLVGTTMALTQNGSDPEAAMVRSFIVETTLKGGGYTYRHEVYDTDDVGMSLDAQPRIEVLSTSFTAQELTHHTEYRGEQLRAILENSSYNRFEAEFAAPDYDKIGDTAQRMHDARISEDAALERAPARQEWRAHEAFTEQWAAERKRERRERLLARCFGWLGLGRA